MINTGVYKIYFKDNPDKIYIGSTAFVRKNSKSIKTGFRQREYNHLNSLKRNKHCNKYLQRAFNKYGEQSFVFEILEYCEPEKCIEREQYYLDLLQPFNENGYNLLKFADSLKGYIRTQEHCKKLSTAIKKYFKNNEIYNKKINKEIIEKVKNLLNQNIHYKDICNSLDIKKSTFYNIKAKLSTGLR